MTNSNNLLTCPCETCLVLAICKNRLNGGDFFDFCALGDSCPQFREFVYPGGEADTSKIQTLINVARNSLLKGIDFNEQVDWGKRYSDEDKNLQSVQKMLG